MNKLLLILFTLTLTLIAEDWPTYMKDYRRSGVSKSQLSSTLKLKWTIKSKSLPQTAWSNPAKWDAYSGNSDLQSLRNFDPAFFVSGIGSELFYGSSVDNAVHCIDTNTSKEKWVFFTNGPVRFPPTVHNNKLYFGSDDGFVYCISKEGKLIWKYQAVPKARMISSNGKLISTWPVRTGVIVRENKVYFAASLVPWEPSYVCCVNAEDGKEIYKHEHNEITLEGAILISPDRLIIPQGRASALMFDLKTGKHAGNLGNAGSTFIILTEDQKLITGPKNQRAKSHVVNITDSKSKTNMAQLDGTDRMIIDGSKAWYHKNGRMICMDRVVYANKTYERSKLLNEKKSIQKTLKKLSGDKKKQAESRVKEIDSKVKELSTEINKTTLWDVESPLPISFIKIGQHIVCGMSEKVTLVDSKSGKTVWSHKIEGKAYGLASWNGHLIISSDNGNIYCFGL